MAVWNPGRLESPRGFQIELPVFGLSSQTREMQGRSGGVGMSNSSGARRTCRGELQHHEGARRVEYAPPFPNPLRCPEHWSGRSIVLFRVRDRHRSQGGRKKREKQRSCLARAKRRVLGR